MNNTMLFTNRAGIRIIKDFESYSPHSYKCPSGVPTIGWGHTKGVSLGSSCNETEAECWLAQDIDYAERVVQMKVDVPLSENQFSALVSFVFNVGVTQFIASTLLRFLNEGLYEQVPEQLGRWIYGRGKGGEKIKLLGLVRRRQAEAELWSLTA